MKNEFYWIPYMRKKDLRRAVVFLAVVLIADYTSGSNLFMGRKSFIRRVPMPGNTLLTLTIYDFTRPIQKRWGPRQKKILSQNRIVLEVRVIHYLFQCLWMPRRLEKQ